MTKHTKIRLQWGAYGTFASGLVIAIAALFMHTAPMAMAQTEMAAKAKVQAAEKVSAVKVVQAADVAAAKVLADALLAKAEVTAPASMAYIDVAKVPIVILPASQPVIIAPVKPDDPKGAAEVVRGAMRTSNWRLVVLGGLLLTVLLLRKVGGFLPAKAAACVNSDRGGAALALAAGILTVVINGLIAGGTFDPQTLIDGVLAAATTAGSFNLAKRLAKPSDLQATPAGPNAPPVG